MKQSNGSTDFVNILTAMTAGAGSSDFNIIGINLNIGGNYLGEDNNGRSGSVNSAVFFGDWDTLDSVGTGFPLKLIIGADTANFDDIVVKFTDLPTNFISVANVHFLKVGKPKIGFFTTRSGTKFKDSNVGINCRHSD